jgi:hypothetical protein
MVKNQVGVDFGEVRRVAEQLNYPKYDMVNVNDAFKDLRQIYTPTAHYDQAILYSYANSVPPTIRFELDGDDLDNEHRQPMPVLANTPYRPIRHEETLMVYYSQ